LFHITTHNFRENFIPGKIIHCSTTEQGALLATHRKLNEYLIEFQCHNMPVYICNNNRCIYKCTPDKDCYRNYNKEDEVITIIDKITLIKEELNYIINGVNLTKLTFKVNKP
jgi:hypothetical protein